jgi:metal-responsive CopG/Arc/MetJ family transcriptional regulator
MRTTDTMTISLPPGMAKQMAEVQKRENRTRSELLREAWRVYFESRYPVYVPTKAERAAISKGRAEFRSGNYMTLAELHHDLAIARDQKGRKGNKTATRRGSAAR